MLPDPDTWFYTRHTKTEMLCSPPNEEDWFGYLRRH
jgi:hypothetical protein